jgi:hypothetical protein
MRKLLVTMLFLLCMNAYPQEPVVFFNGIDGPWFEWYDFWGGQSPTIDGVTSKFADEGTGYTTGKNSIKWVMDSTECGFAWAWWSDWNKFDYTDIFAGGYLDIWIRVPASVDTVKFDFKTTDTQKMSYFLTKANGTFDDTWQHYKIPFKDWVTPSPGYTETVDSSNIIQLGIYTSKGTRGAVVYIGDVAAYPVQSLVLFDGQSISDTFIELGIWGSSYGAGSGIEPGAGYRENTSAIKWVQDIGWGSCGIYWNVDGTIDISGRLATDTLKFKIKAALLTDTLTLEFRSDGDHISSYLFKPAETTDWQIYEIPLSEFKTALGKEAPDYTKISNFFINSYYPNDGSVIYITDVWTGMPVLEVDTTPPAAPASVTVDYVAGNYNYNLVKWTDVDGEEGETYDVYVSKSPITDVTAEGVTELSGDVAEFKGELGVAHYFFSAKTDKPETFYYAVRCVDSKYNVGEPAFSGAVNNAAKGVPVINEGSPINFMADGDLSEWTASDIAPFVLSKSTAFVPADNFFDNDADFTAKIYLAVDDDYLYLGADMTDDKIVSEGAMYDPQDKISLHIGLYNLVTKHDGSTTSTMRSTEPDYQLYIYNTGLAKRRIGDNWEAPVMFEPGNDYYNVVLESATKYYIEAMIPLDSIMFEGDARFHPVKGMKIPIEILAEDRDLSATKDGAIAFSPFFNGWEWFSPESWAETWIGDEVVGVSDEVAAVRKYNLMQNYPNPFNPSTTIKFELSQSGYTSLKIYDVLGREVATLLNEDLTSGQHQVKFDASLLSSGVYYYTLKTGDFTSTRKMMLIK